MASISPERRARLDKERAKNAAKGGTPYLDMKNLTKVVIRVLPLGDDDDLGTKQVRYFINNKFFVCNAETHGKAGVIARARAALAKISGVEAEELAESLKQARRGQRFLMKVLDRTDNAVKIYGAPQSVYQPILDVMDQDGEAIDHPKEGCDIRISKSGSGLDTEYGVRVLPSSLLAETKEERKRILDDAAKLNIADQVKPDEQGALEALMDVIPPKIWKQIEADVVRGLDLKVDSDADGDAGDDDDEDAPPPKAAKKPAKPADDEDEDEAPAKPAKKPAKPSDDDDDEEPPAKPAKKPAASDDDDEDEAPAKPAKKAPADDDDDDDEVPAKAAKKPAKPAADDDDDEAPPAKPARRTYAVEDDDEDEAPAKPAKKPAKPADDDDD